MTRTLKFLVLTVLAVLLSITSLSAHAQEDEDSSEDVDGDNSVLSASEAQGANNRIDIGYSFIDLPAIEQASIEAQYTRVIASHHQVFIVAPLLDPDTSKSGRFRGSDLKIGYSFAPKHKFNAYPWVPSSLGTGIGLSIPTGDLDDGTGIGSWLVAPRLGMVKKIGDNLAIAPGLEYLYSFKEEAGAQETRLLGLSAQLIYVGPRGYWAQWTPAYLYNTDRDRGEFTHNLALGKLFTTHFAVSVEYAHTPVFKASVGGTISDHADVWTLQLHFPFN